MKGGIGRSAPHFSVPGNYPSERGAQVLHSVSRTRSRSIHRDADPMAMGLLRLHGLRAFGATYLGHSPRCEQMRA